MGKGLGFAFAGFATLALLMACLEPLALSDSRDDPAETPVIFIHGIKGSELTTAEGAVQWLTAAQVLGLSTPDLGLEPRFEDGVQPLGNLHPGNILSQLTFIPLLFTVDVYGPFLKWARASKHPFYPFCYDWRRDNLETAGAFAKFVESIKVRHNGKNPVVIAHSMGGLITMAVMNRRPDLFGGVVFAGVPFAGGIGFLPDLHLGDVTGLNKDILSPKVVATFPSVYSFFPLSGAGLVDLDQKVVAADFFSEKTWRELRLGLYRQDSVPQEFDLFFREALARAKRFRELLRPSATAFPPVLVIASKSHPTIANAMRDGPLGEGGWDFASAPKNPGDGRVVYEHALPPAGVPFDLFTTGSEHASLLNDPRVLRRVDEFIGALVAKAP